MSKHFAGVFPADGTGILDGELHVRSTGAVSLVRFKLKILYLLVSVT